MTEQANPDDVEGYDDAWIGKQLSTVAEQHSGRSSKGGVREEKAVAKQAAGISEADLQAAVVELAQRLGYSVFHPRPMQSSKGTWLTPVAYNGKGFPDLVLVGKQQVLFRELKSMKGRLTVEQQAWMRALTESGADVAVWRPTQWLDGTITRELSG